MYAGFIFDLDGVLIDSSRIHFTGWRKVLNELGRDVDYETFLKSYFGRRGADTLEQVFGKGKFTPEEAKNLSDRIDANFVDTVAQLGVPVKGAFEFIDVLKETGRKVALATSAPRQNVDAFLGAFSLSGVFDAEVCGDNVSRGKPDPEVFLKAAALIGEKPEDCVVFEDSYPGVIAAKAAGSTCVALLTTTTREVLSKADFFIKDFTDGELQKIFRVNAKEKV